MLYAAAVILACTGVLHSYLGEKKLLAPLLAMPPAGLLAVTRARRLLRWAWHLTSLAWFALAWLLASSAGGSFELPTVATVLALSLLSAVICFWSAGPRHPGAIAFSICAALLVASRLA